MLEDYLKKNISANPSIQLQDLKVTGSQELAKDTNFKAYFLALEFKVVKGPQKGKDINITDIVFSDGKYLARDLIDLKRGVEAKRFVSLPIDPSLYRDDHIAFGKKDNEIKLVLFSDPRCPFCMDFVPDLFKYIKKYPDKYVLYYYHLPLEQLHPKSVTLVKAVLAASLKEGKDLLIDTYEADFDDVKSDEKSLLEAFNKKFGTKLTLEDINKPEILKHIEFDKAAASKMMVHGTPTLYTNGTKDTTRSRYKALVENGVHTLKTDNADKNKKAVK
jgi:thiol-disulfide isomerase/thioredoxin